MEFSITGMIEGGWGSLDLTCDDISKYDVVRSCARYRDFLLFDSDRRLSGPNRESPGVCRIKAHDV